MCVCELSSCAFLVSLCVCVSRQTCTSESLCVKLCGTVACACVHLWPVCCVSLCVCVCDCASPSVIASLYFSPPRTGTSPARASVSHPQNGNTQDPPSSAQGTGTVPTLCPRSPGVASVLSPLGLLLLGLLSSLPVLVNASCLFKVYFLITQAIHEHLRGVHT